MSTTSLYLHELYKLFLSMNKVEEENKFFLLLLGFVATSLSPFLAVWYLFHCITYVISKIIIPVVGLTLILFVGLPFLCLMRWIYATYDFIYKIILNFFFGVATLLSVRKSEGDDVKEESTAAADKRE